MNQKLIVFITILVSVALLILTAIQAYWINSAVKLREADFNRTVAEAVGDVMQRIERQEMMLEVKKNSEYNNLMRSVDSLDYLIYKETGSYPKTNGSSGGFNYQRQQEWSSVFEDNQWKMVKKSDSSHMSLPGDDTTSLAGDRSGKAKLPELSARGMALNEKKRFLLNQLFDEFFASPFSPNIENRMSKGQLDTLIAQSFTARGIKTEYEFGVFSEGRNIMVIESNPQLRSELMKEGMFFPIFSRAGHVANDFLLLYFPNQTRYLIIQMGGMLIVSGALLLLIVVSFAVVIAAIFRQKKLSEMKNDFINNMTHEFKTPISTVSLACEVLNDPDVTKTGDVVRSYIDIIDQENKRLGVLVEKILRTAILEKGQLNLRSEPLDLHAIIRDVIRKISIQVEIRDGSITTDLKAEETVIYADKVHITNVINNLLDNANKYTPKKPSILVATENMDGGIWVRISDNGMGINKVNQKKIFEKLYRVPTGDVHNVKGFGLGLSYVKFIVEKHEGEIGVESEPGKGSTFKVWLPLAPLE
ncbi:MAG: HAMP domain-containing histidine kinase [Lentimicrobium sp.]|jgi:two-component system phosphate regulon sensor histidine kinase PhoR|nr:HAMP domain-containing histidine kinase [Lentimicrobium sp.]MDD2529057.1 HAMP domain-containing sensor histidine kinase [Lentimicrobiaceae bacterium]MDD4599338.1 HAMP domain-containing sensor histidine kinase [Lentimicrobiaceae bacterium]MDY0026989.1 HAMP domain-containing sensor histidine kinase [Lentimicrobium sp.]